MKCIRHGLLMKCTHVEFTTNEVSDWQITSLFQYQFIHEREALHTL